jgi:hypothetical protein
MELVAPSFFYMLPVLVNEGQIDFYVRGKRRCDTFDLQRTGKILANCKGRIFPATLFQ